MRLPRIHTVLAVHAVHTVHTVHAVHAVRAVLAVLVVLAVLPNAARAVDAAAYPDIQAAIDANPGREITIDTDATLEKRLRIATPGTALSGHATITQTNPVEPVLEIEHAQDVRVSGLTFARPVLEAADENLGKVKAAGIFVYDSGRVVLDGVTVRDCAARDAAIEIRASRDVTVRDASILNYQCLAVDDRTDSELYGYAFRCIDGTGILVNECVAVSLLNNRIDEQRWLATKENKEAFRLGNVCDGAKPTKPGKFGEGAVRAGYVNNWHQGSAIVVTGPEKSRNNIVQGNQIRNSAQGIDLHTDNTIVAGNVVDHGMMGIKATHGARNLIIKDNLLTHIDLWGILLNPGAASHASDAGRGANEDGGTLISNNIITEFGHGNEWWTWGGASDDANGSYAIAIYDGQLPDNPPVRDVILQGNMVYDTDAKATPPAPPRYKYAVYLGSWNGPVDKSPNMPQGLIFNANIFHPGRSGISNSEITP